MATEYISITVIGREALERTFTRFPAIYDKRARGAMNKSTKTVENEIKQNAPVFLGAYRNSIGSEITGFGLDMVGRVGSSLKDEVYPKVIEYGRKPGKMPPVDSLVRWVHLQLGVPNERARGVAYLVARKIARRGIPAKRVFGRAWDWSRTRVEKYWRTAIDDMVKDMRAVK